MHKINPCEYCWSRLLQCLLYNYSLFLSQKWARKERSISSLKAYTGRIIGKHVFINSVISRNVCMGLERKYIVPLRLRLIIGHN